MTRHFPVPINFHPCKRIHTRVGVLVVPIIRANRPIFERRDGTRVTLDRVVAADVLRVYRTRKVVR